jgi:hypothetical protein
MSTKIRVNFSCLRIHKGEPTAFPDSTHLRQGLAGSQPKCFRLQFTHAEATCAFARLVDRGGSDRMELLAVKPYVCGGSVRVCDNPALILGIWTDELPDGPVCKGETKRRACVTLAAPIEVNVGKVGGKFVRAASIDVGLWKPDGRCC